MPHFDEMTQEELVASLRALQADPRLSTPPADGAERERLLHELQVHQIELEMQNRELRESQQLLEESRAWYAELFDVAPIGYCTLDLSGRIQEANLTACELFRIERAKLVGRSLASLVSAGHENAWHGHLQACREQRARITDEIAFTVRGRGPVVMQVVSAESLHPDRSVAGYRTTLSDMSAIKRSESLLRFLSEASEVLASSLEYTQTLAGVVRLAVPVLADVCCIDVLDEAGQLQRLEAAFADNAKQALAGQLKASVPDKSGTAPQARVLRSGRPILASDPEAIAGVASNAEAAYGARSVMFVPLKTREHTFGVLTFMMAESERRYGAKELAVAEGIARRAAIAVDNSRLYQTARAAITSRDDVLAVVSHDLRSPLSGIVMATQAMLGTETNPPNAMDQSMMLRHIERAAKRMHRMVGDLVDHSSIDAGHLSLSRGAHDAQELIAEAVRSLSEQAASHAIGLRVDGSSEPQRVYCDRDRVLQILSNLIGNAIKFTPANGSIHLSAERVADNVRVAVVDTGSGIPGARLPHLFERYYQAHDAPSSGRGLGLYISRRLVEAQGGSIWVESTPGVGSSFFFTLPVAPVAPAEGAPTSASPASAA